MKQIGPSFIDELTAHGGLVGQHFTWDPSGTIQFFDDTPQVVIDGVNAVYAAHDQTRPSWVGHQQQARAALDQSDLTVLRCIEHGVAVPAEWVTYRNSLRAIISATTGDATQLLPAKPAYPVGT